MVSAEAFAEQKMNKERICYFYFVNVLILRASDIEASTSSRSDKSTTKSIYHTLFCLQVILTLFFIKALQIK